jgi:hypothetical protein
MKIKETIELMIALTPIHLSFEIVFSLAIQQILINM